VVLSYARYEDASFAACTPSRFNLEGNLNPRPRLNTNFGDCLDAA
jgi:hypothetical protein